MNSARKGPDRPSRDCPDPDFANVYGARAGAGEGGQEDGKPGACPHHGGNWKKDPPHHWYLVFLPRGLVRRWVRVRINPVGLPEHLLKSSNLKKRGVLKKTEFIDFHLLS